MEIKDARIIVTGGSSGIGKATASQLASMGAKVLITGRDLPKLKRIAEEMGVLYHHQDAAQFEMLPATMKEMVAKLGGLDVLINNAGIGKFNLLENVSLSEFRQVLDTNVIGAALITQAALPYFREQGRGHVINIGSTAAKKGFAYGSVYVASKFALRGMTECWQAELRKENIRVMLINPSEVPTAFNVDDRSEREEVNNKLRSKEIADAIIGALQMDDRGFIPELSVWATNPF